MRDVELIKPLTNYFIYDRILCNIPLAVQEETLTTNAAWIEPQNIAAALLTERDRLRHLGETRPGMPPAVNGWIAYLTRIAGELSKYAESCCQSVAAPAQTATDGICPPVEVGEPEG